MKICSVECFCVGFLNFFRDLLAEKSTLLYNVYIPKYRCSTEVCQNICTGLVLDVSYLSSGSVKH